MILILGLPRSGTTWLATIFDSHENVLYRHEPDIIDRGPQIPGPCPRAQIPLYRAAARDYLLRLARFRHLKCAGHRALFRKTYRSPLASLARLAQIVALRVLAPVWPGAVRARVADFQRSGSTAQIVMKSVSRCGFAGLYATALPKARIVLVIRNPYGQIASTLRGTTLGKLDGAAAVTGLWTWPEAVAHGVTRQRFAAMSLAEQLAWHWVVHTEKALDDLEGRDRVKIVCYETLCADPMKHAGAIFEFAGLAMGEQTRRFVRASTAGSGSRRYYAVRKNPTETPLRWRKDLSTEDQARIASIIEPTRAYLAYQSLSHCVSPLPTDVWRWEMCDRSVPSNRSAPPPVAAERQILAACVDMQQLIE